METDEEAIPTGVEITTPTAAASTPLHEPRFSRGFWFALLLAGTLAIGAAVFVYGETTVVVKTVSGY